VNRYEPVRTEKNTKNSGYGLGFFWNFISGSVTVQPKIAAFVVFGWV
jgi:hypothetical protein